MASIMKRNKSYAVIYGVRNEDGVRKQKWETHYSLESAVKRKEELENPIPFLEISPHINNFKELLDEYIRLHGKLNWSFSMYTNNISLMNRYVIPLQYLKYINFYGAFSTKQSFGDTSLTAQLDTYG